ncbi:methionyl-tRNA formyltransferase [Microcoleus sp. FACHB-1515]|uniref:methionyl-tRNA formyltransferase n=1 Tax=Cyanophyceae TaxID=3028117 RepID=UPI0016841523|nr:methionyl-tRNA formyltransferase [Microcoleus sp. FACHB-1515]MBD2091609.1 methionyl-tRNA formyltransferase [Microcoleus sp. FACHB-1515]
MKIVFLGTPDFAVPTLKRLLSESEFDVLAVVTQPDKRRGRGNALIPSPVKEVAITYEIPVYQPRSIKKDAETLETLRSLQADAFVVVAYGQILSQEILDMPRLGCINAHGSILPYYRGAAPIQWSLVRGEPETGITTMLMDAGMDTGAMLLKRTIAIDLTDNSASIAAQLAEIAADLVVETLQGLAQGTIEPIPQDNDRATYAPLIKKPDFLIDWSKAAIDLHNQIRGFYPNCVATFRDAPLKITATVPLDVDALPSELAELRSNWATVDRSTDPGAIVGLLKQQGAIVQTGDGLILLHEVQPVGKRSQSGWDFVNGFRLTVGEVLENGRE